MENHPIPQDVTGFKFRLIGSMTVKQFLYVLGGGALALLIYILPINFYIRLPLVILFGGFGAALAFVPVEGRPMDIMVKNFLKALPAENQFIYRKKGAEALIMSYFTPPPAVKTQQPEEDETEAELKRKRALLKKELKLGSRYKPDKSELKMISNINSYFDEDDDSLPKMPSLKKSSHFNADDEFQSDKKDEHQKPIHFEKSEIKIARPDSSDMKDFKKETPRPAPAPHQVSADLIPKRDEDQIKAQQEEERKAKEKVRAEAEAKRLEEEKAKKEQEEERLKAIKIAQENALKAQQDKNAEEERLAKQLSETEERIKKEAEKIKQEELALEQKLEEIQAQEKKLEEDRIAREKAAEEARIKALEEAKRAEQERIAKQKEEEEKRRLEEERLARERAEALAKKKAEEAKRLEDERIAQEKAQKEAQLRAQAEAKRLEEEKAARERAVAEAKRLEDERIAKLKEEAEARIRAEIEAKVRAEYELKIKEEAEKRRKIEEQLARERANLEHRKMMLQKEKEEAEKQAIDKTIKESVAKTFVTNNNAQATSHHVQNVEPKPLVKQSDNVKDLQEIINNAASQINTTPTPPQPAHTVGPKVQESINQGQLHQAPPPQKSHQTVQPVANPNPPAAQHPANTNTTPPVDEYGGINNDAAFQHALEQLKSIPYGNQPPPAIPEIQKVEFSVAPQKAPEKKASPAQIQSPQEQPKRAMITPVDTGSEEFEMPHLPSHQPYPEIKENLPKIETIKPEAVSKPEAPAEAKSQPFIPPVVKRTFETAIKPGESKNVRSVAKSDQLNAGFPQLPDIPNIVLGIIKDPRGRVLPNVLVEIMNNQGVPVRAFKTNGLGQFTAATPLADGEYDVVLDDPRKANEFENIHIKLEGKIFQPLEIFSIDAREKLRRELFGGQKAQQAA